jgi:hypothetical protein
MTRVSFRSLKPNVTHNEAVETFRGRGPGAFLTRLRNGALRCVADVYVPFRLYRVEISNGAAAQRHWFALDAVNGMLDLYEFARVPDEAETTNIESGNRVPASLEEAPGHELLREKVLRAVFQQGFFHVRAPKIEPVLEPVELHVPYWLGFYGAEPSVRCGVLDAVRRRLEGAKARAFFEAWLTS